MTTADKLTALPELERKPVVYEPFPNGSSIPDGWPLQYCAASEYYALRARLSLALEVLANSPCSCFYEFRESGKDWLNVCDRCATLVAMKELR